MPRDHGLALELQKQIEELTEKIESLQEELAIADPALASESALKRQTVSITDIAFLGKVEGGEQAAEYSKAVRRIIRDIQDNPYRRKPGGKVVPEKRSLSIDVDITPVLKSERGSDTAMTVENLHLMFKVTSKLPNYVSEGSLAMINRTADGMFSDVRVNPENPDEPRQLSFDGLDDL